MKTATNTTLANLFPSGMKIKMTSYDVDEMREQSVYWPIDIKQRSRGHFFGEVCGVHTNRLQLSLSHRSLGVVIQGSAPKGTTVVAFPLLADPKLQYRGQHLRPFQAIALREDEELEVSSSRPLRLITLACSTAVIERRAQDLTGKSFESLRGQERFYINPVQYKKRAHHLLDLLYKLYRHSGLLTAAEEKMVNDEILETVLLGTTTPQRVRERPERFILAKKAETYLRDHSSRVVSISDLCRAVGTSERTLHLGFKERFGVSPKAYSLMMRLNGVRRELQDLNSHKTITDIAMDWGFFHLGRFSGQYNRLFFETPSMTRQRAQP